MFEPVETLAKPDDMSAQLIEGLRLLARGDIDLGGGLTHRAAVLGLVALGRFEPAGHAAQLLLDSAIGVLRFGLAAADARQHVLRIAGMGYRHGRFLEHMRLGCRLRP